MDTDQTALLAVRRVDYRDARDSQALVALLDGYAQDPMGGGQALSADVHQRLCDDLAAHPAARFYRAVAQFTRAFISVEAQGFDLTA